MLMLLQPIVPSILIDNLGDQRRLPGPAEAAGREEAAPTPSYVPPAGFAGNSVDAIALYEKDVIVGGTPHARVFYSIYGHNPKVPVPYGSAVTWSWWGTAQLAELGSDDSEPQIAFSREGKAMAIWKHEFQNGTCTPSGGTPIPLFESDLHYSLFDIDSQTWSAAAFLASPGLTNNWYEQPAVALDNDGNGLAVWIHRVQTLDPVTCGLSPPVHEVLSSHWSGAAWSAGALIEGFGFNQVPEVAFITRPNATNTPLTAHQAVTIWWSSAGGAPVPCVGVAPAWPKSAWWNGAAWTNLGEVPGRPASPPYSFPAGHKVGISADKQGNARGVWDPTFTTDPCAGPPGPAEIWSANYNGTAGMWQVSAMIDSGAFPCGVCFPDIAHLENDTAIAAYQTSTSVSWQKYTGVWSAPSGVDAAQSGGPSLAALAHERTLAVYSNGTAILFSYLDSSTGAWSTEAIMDSGGNSRHPAVAANTGSPTMPQAEWTFMAYLDGDNDLDPYVFRDFNVEMRAVGSDQLVNLVVLLDRNNTAPDTSSHLYYVEKGPFVERLVAGYTPGELPMHDPATLTGFNAWSLEFYPASRYIIDLNDHGGGSVDSGAGRSQSTVDYSVVGNPGMNLLQTGQALMDSGISQLRSQTILGFDQCLQAGVERAYELRNYARYIVAAEECENASGWPYVPLISGLKAAPFASTAATATLIVNVFGAQFPAPRLPGQSATLSAVDLNAVAALLASVNALAGSLIGNWPSESGRILDAREKAQDVSASCCGAPDYYIDLRNYTEILRTEPGIPAAISANALAVSNQVTATVAATTGVTNYYGLTLYFEAFKDPTKYGAFYDTLAFSAGANGWDEFLKLLLPLEVTAIPTQSAYAPPATINVTGVVTSARGSEAGAEVLLTLSSPSNTTVTTTTATTDPAGEYVAMLSLPSGSAPGSYAIRAVATKPSFLSGFTQTLVTVASSTIGIIPLQIILGGVFTVLVAAFLYIFIRKRRILGARGNPSSTE